ncbi:hypothetical protein BDN70DRAFT_648257 [Pholiota conissans]|uniref:Uncharacterized protein n=1 Tax=Pholiota conissans TaxID=109636 RepID=A0A9P5YL43_9AGAR|nr:hypothetical protein BDN70DRAFT_648257 [Pholiota conissans]
MIEVQNAYAGIEQTEKEWEAKYKLLQVCTPKLTSCCTHPLRPNYSSRKMMKLPQPFKKLNGRQAIEGDVNQHHPHPHLDQQRSTRHHQQLQHGGYQSHFRLPLRNQIPRPTPYLPILHFEHMEEQRSRSKSAAKKTNWKDIREKEKEGRRKSRVVVEHRVNSLFSPS